MKRTLFAIAIAFSLQAQRYDERVTVNVIEVPVNVTRNGHAVRGLTIDDFELFVNGARQKIEYFDVVDDGEVPESVLPAAANAENAPSPLQRRTMTVLLFDTTMTQSYLVNRAKAAAEKFVAEAGPNDTFSVARLGRDGVQFVVPFTRDHVAVRRAVATLAPSRAGDAFGLATLQSELGAVQTALSVEEPGYGHAFESADYGQWQKPAAEFAQRAIKKMNAIEEERRDDDQDRMARHLGELADRLASISGVKHVAFLGEGMTKGANEFYATRMHERFQAAGVILDAIDLDGMRVPDYQTFGAGARASADMGRYLHPLHDKSSSLYMLALGTGGTVAKHGDIGAGLRYLRDMHRVTYVLGFTPPAQQKKNNEVSVRVRRQPLGTLVNYRRGYSTDTSRDRSDGLFLADVLMNDIPQRGVTLDLDVERASRNATVVARVPGVELLAHRSGTQYTLADVFFYVFDEKNLIAGWGYSRLRLDLDQGREFLEVNPYTMRQQFALAPGKYAAKVLMRFVGSDVTAFQRADFEVAE